MYYLYWGPLHWHMLASSNRFLGNCFHRSPLGSPLVCVPGATDPHPQQSHQHTKMKSRQAIHLPGLVSPAGKSLKPIFYQALQSFPKFVLLLSTAFSMIVLSTPTAFIHPNNSSQVQTD